MTSIKELTEELEKIKSRNKKVEADKAWETSLTRKILITIITYIIIVIFFQVSDLPKPFTNAIVPSLAFLLSTLTIPLFKQYWIRKNFN